MLIGKHDITNSKAKKFFADLKKKGADVKLQEFSGGHEIPPKELTAVLKELILH